MSNWKPIYRIFNSRCNIVRRKTIWFLKMSRFWRKNRAEVKSSEDPLSAAGAMLMDESGDLGSDLPNWLDLAREDIQRKAAMEDPWWRQKKQIKSDNPKVRNPLTFLDTFLWYFKDCCKNIISFFLVKLY